MKQDRQRKEIDKLRKEIAELLELVGVLAGVKVLSNKAKRLTK